MPRSVLITTATLVVLAALGGFWLGQRQVSLDTTGVIEAVAARHVAVHGGALTDCLGWPAEGRAIFHVRCGAVLYEVDPLGRVVIATEEGI